MNPEQLAAIKARCEKAHAEVYALCRGDRRWTMSIPANCDTDSDLLIGDALKDTGCLTEALESETARAEKAEAELEALTWFSANPGRDAEDMAAATGIPLRDAVAVTDSLLRRGLLDFNS